MTPRPTSVYQRPRGELVEPRGRDGTTKPSFDRLMYGRRPRCKRNLALMRSGVQVMYSACCCGIEDRWP